MGHPRFAVIPVVIKDVDGWDTVPKWRPLRDRVMSVTSRSRDGRHTYTLNIQHFTRYSVATLLLSVWFIINKVCEQGASGMWHILFSPTTWSD